MENKPLTWELIPTNHSFRLYRTPVFGGWLIKSTDEVISTIDDGYRKPKHEQGVEFRSSLTFIPDPIHQWNLTK